jgi:pimeloyl-ACP methyl ester carboxylesterase
MIPLPLLLIHGFNGQPANWTDTQDRIPDFFAEQGFDPALIRLFSYGYKQVSGTPVYNATGDIREIAHRLDESASADPETRAAAVEQLSRDSVARGGPAKITMIAHSSGGLIARYYLSCRTEDEFQTRYRGNVGRLIMLGTPHLGVDIEKDLDPLPSPLVMGLLAHLHPAFPKANLNALAEMRSELLQLHQTARAATDGAGGGETTAFQQFHPGSDFLQALNRPGAMPEDVEYFNIIGDVRVVVGMWLGNHPLMQRVKSLGDLLVSTTSASTIPNAHAACYPLVQEHTVEVAFADGGSVIAGVTVAGVQPAPLHRHLRSHPAARAQMLELLKH